MKSTIGLVLTSGKTSKLKELAHARSSSAIPVGGKFRAIDFSLSNMVNSGITKIGIITQYSFRSLMDHLGSGREWDLDRRSDGLYVFPPFLSGERSGWYRGSADAIHANIIFLSRSHEEYVLITHGNSVYKMWFDEMLKFHNFTGADITVAYADTGDLSPEEQSSLDSICLDENSRIIDVQEQRLCPDGYASSMGIYLMKRELLMELVEESIARGGYDFVKDIVIKKLKELSICGYCFKGYWRSMNTVSTYYRCNMEMLDPRIREELFVKNGQIYTKVKDEPPAKFNDEADVKNSIVADGCIVEGKVENSVLFRGVIVNKGAIVKDSIVMQDTIVGNNVVLQHAILDKDVVISDGVHLRGVIRWPVIVGKGMIV